MVRPFEKNEWRYTGETSMQSRTQGRNRVGRPKKKWNDSIAEIFTERGILWREAETMADDRDAWREFTRGGS